MTDKEHENLVKIALELYPDAGMILDNSSIPGLKQYKKDIIIKKLTVSAFKILDNSLFISKEYISNGDFTGRTIYHKNIWATVVDYSSKTKLELARKVIYDK